MKHFSIVLIVLFAILLTAIGVYAMPPDTTTLDIDITRDFENCGDFKILLDNDFTLKVTTYYDNEGNRVREREHVNGYHYLYREGYPENGLGASSTDNSQTWFDPETGDVIDGHYAGSPWNVHIPDAGTVYKIAGPAFYVDDYDNIVKEGGKFVYDADALCAYFAF